MSRFDAFVGKISNEINDLSDLYGTVWDEDQVITHCRRCGIEFSLLCRKHHCRECGGIYCDGCAPPRSVPINEIQEKLVSFDQQNEMNNKWYPGKYMGRRPESMSSTTSSSSSVSPTKTAGESSSADDGKWYPGKFLGRKKKDSNGMDSSQRSSSSHVDEEENQLICIGCRYGETPGIQAKGLLKNLYKEYRSQNLNARILSPAKSYSLSYGSLYGEGDKSEKCLRRVDGQPAHGAGYFEILNKSDFATAIRVCSGGSESLREHCRPSYITVLPQQSAYTLFDPSTRSLEVAVLHRNPYFITSNTPMNSLIYNTRGEEVTKEMISPQCAVQNFSEICLYSIPCEGKNVILKYQGAGVIELRKLTTTKRNKKGTLNFISSMLTSSSSSSGSFSTNPQQSLPLPSPSPTNASSTTELASQQSGTVGAGAGWGDGKECILDFSTNATEISRDMASNLF